ncbi:MAG: metal-sulfur cluster assembly factor [Acidimicrobiales bacterium]
MSTIDQPENTNSKQNEFVQRGAVEAAREALSHVYDPELYLDIVSLGLVYDIWLEGETMMVAMTLTTPGCPASETIPAMAHAAIAETLDNSFDVDVRIVWDPPWNPAMIDAEAAAKLGFRTR